MIAFLLAVLAWRILRRLALFAIVAAVAILVLHGISSASLHHRGHHPQASIERVLRSVEHDIQQAIGGVVSP